MATIPVDPFNVIANPPPVITLLDFLEVYAPDIAKYFRDSGFQHCALKIRVEVIDLSDVIHEPITAQNINEAHTLYLNSTQGYNETLEYFVQQAYAALQFNLQVFGPTFDQQQTQDDIKNRKRVMVILSLITPEQWRVREIKETLFDPVHATGSFMAMFNRPSNRENMLAIIEDYEAGKIKIVPGKSYVYVAGQLWGGPYTQHEQLEMMRMLGEDPTLGELTHIEREPIVMNGFGYQTQRILNGTAIAQDQERADWARAQLPTVNALQDWWRQWVKTAKGKEYLKSIGDEEDRKFQQKLRKELDEE